MSKHNLYHLFNSIGPKAFASMVCLTLLAGTPALAQALTAGTASNPRQRISINEAWRFYKYDSIAEAWTPGINCFQNAETGYPPLRIL